MQTQLLNCQFPPFQASQRIHKVCKKTAADNWGQIQQCYSIKGCSTHTNGFNQPFYSYMT